MNFTWQNAEGMQKTYERLLRFVAEAKKETGRTTLSAEKLAKIDEYRTSFYGALEDDVKTPEAMAVVWEVTKSNIPGPDKYDLLIEFDEVLGFDLIRAEEILAELAAQSAVDHATAPVAIKELLAKRLTARETRNWQVADEVRAELLALGYQVIDENDGTQKLEKIGEKHTV
jgi:cysteinyl-tRNA synthetase